MSKTYELYFATPGRHVYNARCDETNYTLNELCVALDSKGKVLYTSLNKVDGRHIGSILVSSLETLKKLATKLNDPAAPMVTFICPDDKDNAMIIVNFQRRTFLTSPFWDLSDAIRLPNGNAMLSLYSALTSSGFKECQFSASKKHHKELFVIECIADIVALATQGPINPMDEIYDSLYQGNPAFNGVKARLSDKPNATLTDLPDEVYDTFDDLPLAALMAFVHSDLSDIGCDQYADVEPGYTSLHIAGHFDCTSFLKFIGF